MATRCTRANSNYLLWSNPGFSLPLTFGAWVYALDVTNTQAICTISSDTANFLSLNLMGGIASDPFQVIARAGGTPRTASIVGATINTWHYVTMTVASVTSRIVRVDGSFSQNTVNVAYPTAPDLTFFGMAAGNSADMRVMWPCLWDTNLGGSDVDALELGTYPRDVQGAKILYFEDHISAMTSGKQFLIGASPSTYNGTWAAAEVSRAGLVSGYGGA